MWRAFIRGGWVFVWVTVILGMRPASAQHSSGAGPLTPLAFLAGSCWKGTFADRAATDEHCFDWLYEGRFLRDHHVVRGDSVPYGGETTFAWDSRQQRIVYWYIALPGFYSHGDIEVVGDALVFHDHLVIANQEQEIRSTWRRSGNDAYLVRAEQVAGGQAHELWSMELRRSRSTK
jgi:hypothetical protein